MVRVVANVTEGGEKGVFPDLGLMKILLLERLSHQSFP
jgi:hypothetical protein